MLRGETSPAMKTIPLLPVLLSILAVSPLPVSAQPGEADKKPAGQETLPEKDIQKIFNETFKVMLSDSLGGLRHGQKGTEVIKLYGEPKSKGENVEWEALGEYVQEWRYPDQGFTLQLSSEEKDGAKTVIIIKADKTCKLATARGIRIGSTWAELLKAYGDVWEREQGEAPGKPADAKAIAAAVDHPQDTFVAGTIYGGVIFTLEKGRVTEIFIGAGAE